MSDAFGRTGRRLALVLGALFAIGVGLALHGYSLSAWRPYVDDSAPTEVLLGAPRPIRSDDWNVVIPLSLAQRAHDPAFPLVNADVGFGQSALVPFPLPVAHPLAVFHPVTWGWFLGSDVGLAWQWWGQLLGLFGALCLWLLAVARCPVGGALAATALAVGSPFVLFWSLRTASVPLYGALAALGVLGVASARRPATIALSGALLAWAGGCFALELYLPFQIPTLLVLGATTLAALIGRRAELPLRVRAGVRAAALVAGVLVPVLALAWLAVSAGDAVDAMRRTTFPGGRVSTGGERVLFELVGANLALPWLVEDWGPLLNVCEAAGFFLLGPPLALAAFAVRGRRPDAVELTALAVLGVAAVHAVVGFPEWLARATGFALVPGRRSMGAIGLADAALVARLLARPGGIGAPTGAALAAGAGWTALLALAAARMADTFDAYPLALGIALAAANGGLVAWAALARRGAVPVAAAALASLAVSIWFNPLVRGGSDWLRENPLSREILAIDAERDGASTWVSFGGPYLPNLFRAIGVHALNGLHPVPQPALWAELDPAGRHRTAWNRYAHLAFVAWPRPALGVRLLSRDSLIVSIHPRAAALRALGVTHMLVETDEPELFGRLSGHVRVASMGPGLHVFEARWDADGGPGAGAGDARDD